MRVVQVVGYIGDKPSGPAYTVPSLCRSLASEGLDVELHVNEGEVAEKANYSLYVHKRWSRLGDLEWSPALCHALKVTARTSDFMHSHGLWAMPYIYPGWAVRGTECRLVISPRGTLRTYAWNRSRWKKRLIWHLWQRRVLEDASLLHATCDAEYEDIRRLGIRLPVAVIPNGIDMPNADPMRKHTNRRRRLLFLSRIHPIKAPDLLIRAWVGVQQEFPDWEMWVVGPLDSEYARHVQSLARSLRADRTFFPGQLVGQEKAEAYASSDLFVLPSHSENFGVVVAEALAYGLPAIVFKGAPWGWLESEGCGWWIDPSEEDLRRCLAKAMAMPCDKLAEMGRRGREWMARDFSWDRVGRMMRMTYEWVLRCGDRPPWIRVD